MAKFAVDKSKIDQSERGAITIDAEVFAFFEHGDHSRPMYAFFVDTSAYDGIFSQIRADGEGHDESDTPWTEKITGGNVRIDMGGLDPVLMARDRYGLPKDLTDMTHYTGGRHSGEKILHGVFKNAEILFTPFAIYETLHRNDLALASACELLYAEGSFRKGDASQMGDLGVRVQRF